MRIFFSIISFLIILSSCQKKSEDSILAEVYVYTLFYDDVIYNLSNISDTNSYLNNYVDDWVSKKVLLNQAYINIDDNTDELEKVSDYKLTFNL